MPRISVIIPTRDRADLLAQTLESFAAQSVPNQFELIVVDDGSADHTPDVCRAFAQRAPLNYVRLSPSGLSIAKNEGVHASSAPLVMFQDDDDLADPRLVEEHLRVHDLYPDERVAVLGYTTWAPGLQVTPIMEYVTNIGQDLFAYKGLTDGSMLDFTYFWGGRSSCKRSLLTTHGLFNPSLPFGLEDVELGFRLAQPGLRVVYSRRAVTYMNRPVTFDGFCRRVERQGVSQYVVSQMHAHPFIQRYCQVVGAAERWAAVRDRYAIWLDRVHELEAALEAGLPNAALDRVLLELLDLYRRSFDAMRLKGYMQAAAGVTP